MKKILFLALSVVNISFSQKEEIDLYNKIRIATTSNLLDSSYYYSVLFIESTANFDSLVGFVIDTDLEILRENPYGFKIDSLLLAKYVRQYRNVIAPQLGYQLWKFGIEDQKTRSLQRFIRDQSYLIEDKDSLYLAIKKREYFVIENLKRYKFLTNSIVGSPGSKGAFLVIQHSGSVDYLKLYSKSLKRRMQDIDPRLYALAKDRLLIKKGKKQIYGTQVGKISGIVTQGVFVETSLAKLAPIRGNEIKVDRRRKKIGLEPLKDDPVWELIKNINEKVDERTKQN
ncbi:MAG: hypothetical protein PHQ74_06445 [Crocinitomicaceae bacterium]|nr:hypothetical protein [Crocinitomicaceae bacterium]